VADRFLKVLVSPGVDRVQVQPFDGVAL